VVIPQVPEECPLDAELRLIEVLGSPVEELDEGIQVAGAREQAEQDGNGIAFFAVEGPERTGSRQRARERY
jgi:hypothetical protein